MSENVETLVYKNKLRARMLVLVLSVLVLLLVYGAGFIALPVRILTSYRDRACDSVLSLNKIYRTLYPKFMEDASLAAPVNECQSYVLAVTSEQNEKWSDAYEAYEKYLNEYPGGIYAKTAYEHRASALIHVVEDQAEQEKYEGAISNLDLLLDQYADTDAAADAWTLTPKVFTAWGMTLRESDDFETAVRVFSDFSSWAEHYQRNDAALDAKRELAKTFVTWGLDLQSQGKYEDAIAKFEMAVKIDPSQDAKAAQQEAYIEWGNVFLTRKDFLAAIKKFELSVDIVGVTGDKAQDALTNGYIQWAADLSSKEDFLGALRQLGLAKETATTDNMKDSVETAFSETYLAFANSDGDQAKQAMADAQEAICKSGQKPELPIFGLKKDTRQVGVYGVKVVLPDDLLANTPAELSYVACITEEPKIFQRVSHSTFVTSLTGNFDHVQKLGNRYFVSVFETRYQIYWNIHLWDVSTAKELDDTVLSGSTPPPLARSNNALIGSMLGGGSSVYGEPPNIDLLLNWLQTAMK